MKLSKLERINLIHQHEILQKLYPENADYHEKAAEILRCGYEFHYDIIYDYIYDGSDILTKEECLEVWDTLGMFDSIDRTIKDLNLSHDDFEYSKFFGYDGNNEGKFRSFAEFTITKDDRFTYLPLPRENYFNSHMPTRGIYARMLAEWETLNASQRFPMSKENLVRVLNAAIPQPKG